MLLNGEADVISVLYITQNRLDKLAKQSPGHR